MKNLLIIYALSLSIQLSAQNSLVFFGNSPGIDRKADIIDLDRFQMGKLLPVDTKPEKPGQSALILDRDPGKTVAYDFSSLKLMDQLRELDLTTPFNVNHNATLERFIRVYLSDQRDYLNRILGKSIYYFPLFEKHLDAYDLPLELKYLAVVESALNQTAVSPSGARGIWQFMYGTGREYNLYIDSYVDERYDPIRSTEAACRYLKKLYRTFGDWDLALAAYNSGPGNVRKAIKRAGGNTNYWEIRQYLPRETSSYVPAFYATMYLFSYADYHKLRPVKEGISYHETDTLTVKGSLSFETIVKNTGIDTGMLRSLNPQYKQDFIPEIRNRSFAITLPVNSVPDFLEAEKDLYERELIIDKRSSTSGAVTLTLDNSYLVREGDNLNRIAQMHQISLEQLKTWNGLETNFLIAGQRLVVRNHKSVHSDSVRKKSFGQLISLQKNQQAGAYLTYVVQNGDTLFKISRRFKNVSIADLRNWNGLDNVNYLKPGTQLVIRKKISGNHKQMDGKS